MKPNKNLEFELAKSVLFGITSKEKRDKVRWKYNKYLSYINEFDTELVEISSHSKKFQTEYNENYYYTSTRNTIITSKMGNKRKYEPTKHHIIPKSRDGMNELENICYVPRERHEKYHALFENRTPEEIMEYLNKEFWKSNYEISIKYIK